MKNKSCLALLSFLLLAQITSADQYQLGLGAQVLSSPYIGDSNKDPIVIPIISYEGDRLKMDLLSGVSYDFIKTGKFSASILGAPRWQGYDPKDNKKLSGMNKRDPALDIGVSMKLETNAGTGTITALTDATGVHKGSEISTTWSLPLSDGNSWLVSPYIGAKWQSKELLSYYYGVRPEEVQISRQEYTLNEEISWFSGLDMQYALTPKISIIGNVSYSELPKNIKASPIVDKDHELSSFIGALYVF